MYIYKKWIELPQELQNFFENKELLKTGVNIKMDGQKLYRDFGIKTNGLVELMTLANLSKSSDITRTHHRSLRALTAIFVSTCAHDPSRCPINMIRSR